MPSHMSSIGFFIENEAEFKKYADMTVKKGWFYKSMNGFYLRLTLDSGVELWAQIDKSKNFIGLNPHFNGSAKMKVGLTERIDRSKQSILDGAFYAWANPEGNIPETGCFPFVFDVPNSDLYNSLKIPQITDVQLSAFAHDIEIFQDDDSYYASQDGEAKFASESFIPSGLFTPDGESTVPPQAMAIFTGHVLDSALLTNSVTNEKFYWIKVKTLGGEIDVVADTQIVKRNIVPGGVIKGSFWMSGKLLIEPPKENKGFFQRIFGY